MIRARKKLPHVRLISLCVCWALGACEQLPTWTGPAAKDWPTHWRRQGAVGTHQFDVSQANALR